MPTATRKKDIDSILAQPLTPVRVILAQKFSEKTLTAAERDKLVDYIRNTVDVKAIGAFDLEESKIEAALESGSLASAPNLSTPELQLLWAAHLTQALSADIPIAGMPLWKQLVECDFARHELRRHAAYIARDQFNPGTRLIWGKPGSEFMYLLPPLNQINIDFAMSLIGGFEDTRAIIFHEIGHSKLTRGFTDTMKNIREEMVALDGKGKTTALTPAEYTKLHGLAAKWEYIYFLWDEAENSPVNRYSINAGPKIQQDMDASLNSVEVVITNAANNTLPTAPDPVTAFINFKRAVRMSLFKNNRLFSDDTPGWERMGVRREWIKAVPSVTGQANPLADFDELMELCGGVKGLEQLQPGTLDRMKGTAWLESVTEQKAAERNKIIDDIWERYAWPIVEPLVKEAENQADQNVQNAIQKMQQAQSGQPQQPGQGQPGQGQPGQGQSGQGQPGEGGSGSGGDMVDVDKAGKLPGVKIPAENPEEAAKAAREAAQGKNGQPGGESGEGKGSGGEGADDENGEDAPPGGKGEGETIDDLLQQLDNSEQTAPNGGQPSESGSQPNQSSSRSSKGGVSKARNSQVRIGSWGDYQSTAKLFTPQILQGKKFVRQIQDRQSQILSRATNKFELEPAGGDMELFEMDRHTDMLINVASGKRITEDDAKRFRIVQETKKPAVVDFVISIDGSASMFWKAPGWKYSPMEAGMHTACIMTEVTRNDDKKIRDRAPINTWVYVWGNDPPLQVSKPGEDRVEIGKKISGLRENQGWGTSLAPAVMQSTKDISEEAPNTEFAGAVHNVVVSDGDIADDTEAFDAIDALLTYTKNVTFDVLIVNPNGEHGRMANVVRALQDKHGEGRVKLVLCEDPGDAHAAILLLLRERMLATRASEAMPTRQRQQSLKRAHEAMFSPN